MKPFLPLHRTRIRLAAVALLTLLAPPVPAQLLLDLSYVDTASPEYQRFKGWVDDAVAGNPGWAFSAADAATLYRLTHDAQYAQLAVSMIEAQVTAAEAAIANVQEPEVAGDSYLYVADMIAPLALTLQWCAGYISATQETRWSAYAEQAIWNVWHHSQAEWGGNPFPWSGWSTDNPGNNYHYSFLKATAWWAWVSGKQTWKDLLINDKLPALQAYFVALDDGGSLEGTSYGVSHARLFNIYRMWEDSTGVDLANANDHLTESIAWWIHATVPTRDFVSPIGDQARVSEPEVYDYHRHLMLEARYLSEDAAARDDASWWLHHILVDQYAFHHMSRGPSFIDDLLPDGPGGTPPAQLHYHAVGTGQLFARTGWSTDALWLNFTAGPFVESHAHQSQGAFKLYAGDWVAVTANIWSHSGIHRKTEVHNVLRFVHNGQTVEQQRGTQSSMSVSATGPGGELHAVADLTPAYAGDPAVQSWTRAVGFGNHHLSVVDEYAVGANTSAVFQVNTAVAPLVNGNSVAIGAFTMRVLEPANPVISVLDWAATDSEYHNGWRIDVAGGNGRYVVDFFDQDVIFAADFGAP